MTRVIISNWGYRWDVTLDGRVYIDVSDRLIKCLKVLLGRPFAGCLFPAENHYHWDRPACKGVE